MSNCYNLVKEYNLPRSKAHLWDADINGTQSAKVVFIISFSVGHELLVGIERKSVIRHSKEVCYQSSLLPNLSISACDVFKHLSSNNCLDPWFVRKVVSKGKDVISSILTSAGNDCWSSLSTRVRIEREKCFSIWTVRNNHSV